jgi:hypothetical protein
MLPTNKGEKQVYDFGKEVLERIARLITNSPFLSNDGYEIDKDNSSKDRLVINYLNKRKYFLKVFTEQADKSQSHYWFNEKTDYICYLIKGKLGDDLREIEEDKFPCGEREVGIRILSVDGKPGIFVNDETALYQFMIEKVFIDPPLQIFIK